MEFLYEYGVFLAKAVTIVVAILLVVGFIIGSAARQKNSKDHLNIESLSEKYDDIKAQAESTLLSKDEYKQLAKERKKQEKREQKEAKNADKQSAPNRMFVLDFDGSMNAEEVEQLREEVSAIICIAQENDQVLLRLESGGGVVHGYGLAASQLERIRQKGIKLTVSVDKVAASGGYMMACVADKIIAAPFAIIGSIGVIAQLPNFNKVLKNNNVDFEQHTAGNFKRTLTMFGENTAEGRTNFKEEIEDVHRLFKDFVSEHRPNLDIERVATGEVWYGKRAIEHNLVDEITTSDDFLISANESLDLYKVQFESRKTLAQKFGIAASTVLEKTLLRLHKQTQHWGIK